MMTKRCPEGSRLWTKLRSKEEETKFAGARARRTDSQKVRDHAEATRRFYRESKARYEEHLAGCGSCPAT